MKPAQTVTIVGVGLIGGSIGLALRKRQLAEHVIGTGSRPQTLETALQLGAITAAEPDLATSVAGSSLVVVCAPVDAIVPTVRQLAPHCAPGTLITDAGSTKQTIVRELESAAGQPAWPAGVRFVGSHPLAGNEKKGPRHGSADLLIDRTVVVTPGASTSAADCQAVGDFWRALGAKVVEMPADEHDRALAVTSHLPHLVASAIAGVTPPEYLPLSAGGWQDTTRIAAGDPTLWQQILLSNQENVLAALQALTEHLARWQSAIEAGDASAIEQLLVDGKRIRDKLYG